MDKLEDAIDHLIMPAIEFDRRHYLHSTHWA
jgi:hypothetical protein